jgi:hypothetical protein
MKYIEKKTEFTGYMSGDGECFCLEKRKLEDVESIDNVTYNRQGIMKRLLEDKNNRLYPDEFFPDECKDESIRGIEKMYKFTITVIAEEIK